MSCSQSPGCPDVVERAPRPVPGHPARGQPSAGRLLGKIRGVLTLIPGVAATDAQRFVGTGGILVVADIEVRTELRRGQIELTADHLVPGGHRQQDNRESSRQEPHQHKPPRREVSLVPEQPEPDGTREHQRVLAGQHQTAKGQSDAKPRPPAIGFPHQPAQQRQQQTQQEDVEDRFLYETVEEDGWRIAGQHHPGDDPDRLREQAPPGECQQDTRERADDSLTQPHDHRPIAEHRIYQTEKIGIERRLIEDLAADDVAGRDLLRPRVIALCISHQQVEKRSRSNLPQMQQSNNETEEEDGEGVRDEATKLSEPARVCGRRLHRGRRYGRRSVYRSSRCWMETASSLWRDGSSASAARAVVTAWGKRPAAA